MKNAQNSSDNIVYIILSLIIISIVAFAIFTIFNSNKSLYSNEINNAKNQENNVNNIDATNNINAHNNSNNQVVETIPIEEEITSYTTTIYDQDENRVYNISHANEKLNNYIIKNGEEFSFNNTIGDMSEAAGFKKALGFDSNGNKIQISAGGLCQISSTLYNTALNAGFEITERHAHSARVAYVPKDRDATILYGSLDLKFKNNSGYDVKIISTNDNANVTIKLMRIKTETKIKES